jgi:hypothetical protein
MSEIKLFLIFVVNILILTFLLMVYSIWITELVREFIKKINEEEK